LAATVRHDYRPGTERLAILRDVISRRILAKLAGFGVRGRGIVILG
jgi:hypothetical protein